MRCAAIPVLLALTVAPAAASQATNPGADSAAVLAVVRRFFDGMLRHDTTALRATLVPGSQFVVYVAGAVPSPPRRQSDSSFLASMTARQSQRLLERIWTPTVLVHDGVAMVWAPYDFHISDAFSHCGVDNFSLIRTPAGWQIAGITYTVERTGCAPSPLGAPAP